MPLCTFIPFMLFIPLIPLIPLIPFIAFKTLELAANWIGTSITLYA